MRVYENKKSGAGQMTLPFILLVSGVIMEIAIAGAFVAYFLSTSGYGGRLSIRANAAANSGIRDAMVRISQDKEFTSEPCNSPFLYSFSVGQDSTSVSVCRSIDFEGTKYTYTVDSIGYAGTRQKKLSARILVDETTGQVQLESVIEQSVE